MNTVAIRAIPEWHGWHAARRGLGSNLVVIQRILRHANVSTTATYYIETAADDVRNTMAKLEDNIPSAKHPEMARDAFRTGNFESFEMPVSAHRRAIMGLRR